MLALYAALLSSRVLSNPPKFLWLPLTDLKEKERVLVTFTYSHRDKIKHDCSGHICDSRIVAVEEKTSFCQFREIGSQSFQPGLLRNSLCEPLQQTELGKPIASDSLDYEVEVLAEVLEDIVFCFFRQEAHGKSIRKIGLAYPDRRVCHRLSTDGDPNTETTGFNNITRFLSAATRVLPIQSWPDCSQQSLDDNDFESCTIYKCWKSKRGNAFYGKDECTGQCRTEDCVYINIDDDLRRCCEGTSGCDTQCPNRKALITGLSVGLGTPVLLVCICVVLIAWDDENFVEDTCSIAYRGVKRLLAWTGRGVSTLVGYCARCPECCARQLSALVSYGGDQGHEVPEVVVTAEPSGIDVERPELPNTQSPEESSFFSTGPPAYDEVVKM